MNQTPTLRTPALWVLALLLLIGYQLGANHAAAPARPATIGMVDLKKLIDNLNIRVSAEDQVRSLADRLEEQRKAKFAAADQYASDLDALVRGTPKYQEAESKAKQAAIDARTFTEYAKLKIDQRAADNLLNVYEQVKAAARKFSSERGFDLILVDDSVVKLERASPEAVLQQIWARRVLYSIGALDVTEEFTKWMNSQSK
jgi:Skp family chaperone for outer membrane proteins